MKRGAQTLTLITILLFSITFVVAEDSNQTTDDLVTCDAFWQGYELNKETNECELQGTSGCSNPFKYSTKEECEQRTPKDNDQGKNDPELETCRDKCKANFEDEKNRGQCIRKCKGRFKFKDEFEDGEIELIDGGTTPDSFWYFLDTMFDGFSDDIAVKEEKVAEIKAMIEKGDLESARKALKHYKEYAEELGKEIDPKDEEAAKRSSLAIEKALTQIEDKLSADDKKEFYDDILDNEEKITTAVEIASKIKNAGAIFIGEYSPVATGDYFAGPSHTLPTGITAKFFGALSSNDFVKSTSIIEYDKDMLAASADDIIRLAKAEGLDAHAKSVEIRLKKD